MSSASRSLARGRDFAVVCASQTVSVLGGAVTVIAIPLLVLDATSSLTRIGLVTALIGVGGPLDDHLDRRRPTIRGDLVGRSPRTRPPGASWV